VGLLEDVYGVSVEVTCVENDENNSNNKCDDRMQMHEDQAPPDTSGSCTGRVEEFWGGGYLLLGGN
jgi:hypothetical protein